MGGGEKVNSLVVMAKSMAKAQIIQQGLDFVCLLHESMSKVFLSIPC